MSRVTSILLMGCIIGVVASAAAPSKNSQAHSPSTPATKQPPDDELEEILVEGRKPTKDKRQLIAWIDRLGGQFSYEGYVERYDADGVAARAEVHGGSRCSRFDKAMAVQCLVNANWPGIPAAPTGGSMELASSLTPAVVVYGVSMAKTSIGYLQVDNNGVATSGKGWLVDDTLISKAPCADFPDCQRVLRLQAPAPDARVIHLRVDLEQKGRLRLRHDFQWKRLTASQAAGLSDASPPGPGASPSPHDADTSVKVPPDIASWLRRLEGQYRVPGLDETCASVETMLASRPDLAASRGAVRCPRSKEERASLKNRPADARCEGIGAGPGMRCVVYMAWPESGVRFDRKWYMSLNPSFVMFGFDPVAQGIAVVQVYPTSDVGPAAFAAGGLKNDKLNYLEDCSRTPCNAVKQWSIAPKGEWVRVDFAQAPGTPAFIGWHMLRMMPGTAGAPNEAVTEATPNRPNPSPRRQ
jgi:hypothetical protein